MNYLRVADLGRDGFLNALDLSMRAKSDPAQFGSALAGYEVGLFYMKPSTRTRVSTEVAVSQLGGRPMTLRNEEVGLGKREAPADVARTLDRYLDVLALRVFEHEHLDIIGAYAKAPVINLLSDLEHPCQALADVQTMSESRSLPGSVLTFIGDGNNVCHSLMIAAAMLEVEVRVAAPEGYAPLPEYVEAASQYSSVVVTADVNAAVEGSDFVYTDVWASMGQEDEAAERRRLFEAYRVDERLFGRANDGAIFLHCLPAHRGEEVTDGVADHPRSRIFDQAENRMHSFKGVLLHLTQ
ncbi:MAG TPA: ornithine carbamoyltransferase [Acidimicrobiia bacterium]|nr:ornithine carbamoyltransferase [Acidimicrobiia bacterium]